MADLDDFFSEIAEAETTISTDTGTESGSVPVKEAVEPGPLLTAVISTTSSASTTVGSKRPRGEEGSESLKSEEDILKEELKKLKPAAYGEVIAASAGPSGSVSTYAAPSSSSAPNGASIYGPSTGSSGGDDNVIAGPSPYLTNTLGSLPAPSSSSSSSSSNDAGIYAAYQPSESSYGSGSSKSNVAAPSMTTSVGGIGTGLASATTTTTIVQRSTKKFVRSAAGETWTDLTLQEWPENDFRLFVG